MRKIFALCPAEPSFSRFWYFDVSFFWPNNAALSRSRRAWNGIMDKINTWGNRAALPLTPYPVFCRPINKDLLKTFPREILAVQGNKKKRGIAKQCLSEWSGWLDSNQRPPAPKAGILTGLNYIPNRFPGGFPPKGAAKVYFFLNRCKFSLVFQGYMSF